jgi:S1-C subfamily serine protease
MLAYVLIVLSVSASYGQPFPPSDTAGIIGKKGNGRSAPQYSGLINDELRPAISGFSKFANTNYHGSTLTTRGAKEAQIYKDISPSVVMIMVKEGNGYGIGSGTLINVNGEILTNWHVVKGAKEVAVLFKPAEDGQKPGEKDIVRGIVSKYDAVADLALIKVSPPAGRKSVALGEKKELAIGLDVFAIGHPGGDDWTYTKGIISQLRSGYEWTYNDKTEHRADVIQTQTPINPGNSGGPLLSDTGTMVGVNSFASDGEGLNFAVALGEINSFLARNGNRETTHIKEDAKSSTKECEVKVVDSGRTSKKDADYDALDLDCDGKADAAFIKPDDKTKAFRLSMDNNGDEKPDCWILDMDRDGKWDVSFWATKNDGKIDVVGQHPDGKLEPTSYESFDAFKARTGAQAKSKP